MQHFEYVLDSGGPGPIKGPWTALEWFSKYKVGVEGEVWVPDPRLDWEQSSEQPNPGDMLWFIAKFEKLAVVMSKATISKVIPDLLNNRQEFWFLGSGHKPKVWVKTGLPDDGYYFGQITPSYAADLLKIFG
jgi:hypothetical protein